MIDFPLNAIRANHECCYDLLNKIIERIKDVHWNEFICDNLSCDIQRYNCSTMKKCKRCKITRYCSDLLLEVNCRCY